MKKNSNIIYTTDNISLTDQIQKKHLSKKCYALKQHLKNKKKKIKKPIKVLSFLSQLEQKYPEKWGYGFKTFQGGGIGSRR